MEWPWILSGVSCLIALAALGTARRLSRRLSQLSEQVPGSSKYEHGELKARVKAIAPTDEERLASQPAIQQTFVPLTSIKKK